MSRYEQTIKDGAARLLEDSEDVLAAVIAAPRTRPRSPGVVRTKTVGV